MFKKLKSLFVVEDGSTASNEKQGNESGTPSTQEVRPDVAFDLPKNDGGQGQVQDKFLEVLFKALEANNQDGFDYIEFKEFLKSLANVPMDDNTRYKSAFATAQTMGATKEKLLSSARHYMDTLGVEKQKFEEALNGQKQRNLTGKQDEIKNLENGIKQKEASIDQLNKDIDASRKQIAVLEEEIGSAHAKIMQTANDFDATYKVLLQQIQSDVSNIESHL